MTKEERAQFKLECGKRRQELVECIGKKWRVVEGLVTDEVALAAITSWGIAVGELFLDSTPEQWTELKKESNERITDWLNAAIERTVERGKRGKAQATAASGGKPEVE